jgi:hypothetical protein
VIPHSILLEDCANAHLSTSTSIKNVSAKMASIMSVQPHVRIVQLCAAPAAMEVWEDAKAIVLCLSS